MNKSVMIGRRPRALLYSLRKATVAKFGWKSRSQQFGYMASPLSTTPPSLTATIGIPKKLLSGGEFRKVERIGETGLAMVTPKSKKARRSVELPPKLAELLVALRNRQKNTESTFVFQNEIGAPIDPDSVYDVLHTAQDKAGARRFGLHGLRHLYSSPLVANKVDVKFAQARLGHASAMTTLNIYSHEMTKHGHEYAAAIEAAFPFVSNLLAEGQIAVPTQQNVN